jgi:hypothetical protein
MTLVDILEGGRTELVLIWAMDQSPERSIISFRPHEKALSIAKGCFAGSQEAPAARHSPLCKLDHELEQRVSMRYFVAITRVRHHYH